MDFSVWKDVCIGSVCALSVLVFLRWWCRNNEAKQIENTVEPVVDAGDTTRDDTLEPKHAVFLSHSGAQKNFVEQLCVDLERCDRYPFFDKRWDSLPIGRHFPKLIFEAIQQCQVGVVVLSEDFFIRSKWPMLELVAMTKNPKLVIIPVFLDVSLKQVQDPKHQKNWLSIWRHWARKDKRIDIEGWCGALKALGPLNSLVYDGLSEVSFREKIVQAVCDIILPQTRWKDSHVQGRSRLFQVIYEKIDQAIVSKKYGIPMVGLYGVGGIGKTTICQVLCNEFSTIMQGRVYHVELGSTSELELLQGALKTLTTKSHDVICGLNKSQSEDLLKREMQKHAVFLAIDNMSDSTRSIEQAKMFLTVGFDNGSMVIVTARSLEILKLCHLDIDENNYLEMPELHKDEAKSLFMDNVSFDYETRMEVDDEIIDSCLKRCYFKKGDGKSYHYHPLALKVLGIQLGCNKYDQNKWAAGLKDLDLFNLHREEEHPIFSILRKSFDILLPMDQMLFMDVALFLPKLLFSSFSVTSFEWLSIVHGTSVHHILDRLEGLKRKSLLQDLGDGGSTRIGMHDLWREFGVVESKVGEFEGRRWVYEEGGPSTLEEGSPSGSCWQNMKRMCFLGNGLMSAKTVNFAHFSNITVLKLIGYSNLPVNLVLDLSKMKHLKSLELNPRGRRDEVVGLGLVEGLQFLVLVAIQFSGTVIDDIGHLTKLRVLYLSRFKDASLLDVSKLICLEEVHLEFDKVATIFGFSARMSNLRSLDLSRCWELRSLDHGVGELVALWELSLSCCWNLNELPNLQKLTNLRKLNIDNCWRIKSVPGLDSLVALEKLSFVGCSNIVELPNLQKLTNLRKLVINSCSRIQSVAGLDYLVTLERLGARKCSNIVELPNLQKLINLQILDISHSRKIKSLLGLGELVALERLGAQNCSQLTTLPNVRKLSKLQVLDLKECLLESALGVGDLIGLQELHINFQQLPCECDQPRWSLLRELDITGCSSPKFMRGVANLLMLESLTLSDCVLVDEVPDCQNLKNLKMLEIANCEFKDFSSLSDTMALESLTVRGCCWLERLPNMEKLIRLKRLTVEKCGMLQDALDIRSLAQLKSLRLEDLPLLRELPDLSNFPCLFYLSLGGCAELVRLASTQPLVALNWINLNHCHSLKSIPNVSHFQKLRRLTVQGCNSLKELTCTKPLASLTTLKLCDCRGLNGIPDLSNFPQLTSLGLGVQSLVEFTRPLAALEELTLDNCWHTNSIVDLNNFQRLNRLELDGCKSLTELTCIGPLTSHKTIKLKNCCNLRTIPDLSNFGQLEVLELSGGDSLAQLTCTGPLAELKKLKLSDCRSLKGIPDLYYFPQLRDLSISSCESLTQLTCTRPMTTLEYALLSDCSSLKAIPDLSNFPQLVKLTVDGCGSFTGLTCIGLCATLEELNLSGCGSMNGIPDLSNFSQLKVLEVKGGESLKELTCSGPLAALEELNLGGCQNLRVVPDLSNFPSLNRDKYIPQDA